MALPLDLRTLNARELHQAVVIAIRKQSRSEAVRVVAEHRRRGIKSDPKTRAWLRDTFGPKFTTH